MHKTLATLGSREKIQTLLRVCGTVSREHGTVSNALRSFLRQDPDVIMVGEIRDLETAEIAIKAAQTGHLVFSTLHTNDAPQSITRLEHGCSDIQYYLGGQPCYCSTSDATIA